MSRTAAVTPKSSQTCFSKPGWHKSTQEQPFPKQESSPVDSHTFLFVTLQSLTADFGARDNRSIPSPLEQPVILNEQIKGLQGAKIPGNSGERSRFARVAAPQAEQLAGERLCTNEGRDSAAPPSRLPGLIPILSLEELEQGYRPWNCCEHLWILKVELIHHFGGN